MIENVALFGAGGKMGRRVTANLRKANYDCRYVEINPDIAELLSSQGIDVVSNSEAASWADAVILALPDRALGTASEQIVPLMKPGSMLMTLDPAAAHAGVLARRDDVCVFVTHPCHPPVFNDETDPTAKKDYFGGVIAKQNIVCALENGAEEDYSAGERLARTIYEPVIRAHRITVEQMAILEPAMAETVAAALITVIKEAMDEAIAHGVPPEAARDFMLGHVHIPLAIVFGEVSSPFSDGALMMIDYGKSRVVKQDWRSVFDAADIKKQVNAIVQGQFS